MSALRTVLCALGLLASASLVHAQTPPAPPAPPMEGAAPTASAAPVEPGVPLSVPDPVPAPVPAEPPPQEPAAVPEGLPEATASAAPAAWDYLDAAPADVSNGTPGDVDLAALGLPGGEETERFPKIDLYGFADLTFWQPLTDKDNAWAFYFSQKSTFWVGNINLYVASQMSKTLRSLLEVRFTYLPQGKNRSALEPQGQPYVDNSAADYTDAERPIKLGAIEIERVQMEYAPVSWLSVVAGQWLTPYGIWNVDHGSPTTIMSNKPYVVGEQYIPERQTGLLIQGSARFGIHRMGYNVGLSNGRGPIDSYYDMDNNKAGTLHLSWQSNSRIGDLTLGSSAYLGRYTSSTRTLGVKSKKIKGKDTLQLVSDDKIAEQYDEYTLALDAKWISGGYEVFAEAIMQTKKYTDEGRPELQGSLLALIEPVSYKRVQPDTRRTGGYLIAGYRFKWLGLMPFVQLEFVHLDVPDMPMNANGTSGINVRPHESVAIKVHYGYSTFPGANPGSPGRDDIHVFATQLAWAF